MTFKKRSFLFLADLHVGSPYSPWPEKFQVDPGFFIHPSDGQMIINDYLLNKMMSIISQEKVDTVILLGDIIDGGNRKEYARDRMTADLDNQVKAAIELLLPVCKGRQVYGVHGTGYHDSLDMKAERFIIEELARNGDGGKYWGPFKNFRVNNCIFNVSHGVGGALIYRATKSDRELLHALAGEAAGKVKEHIDIFVRAHLHFFGYLDNGANRYLACPCFTDWIPYKFSLKLYGRQPDMGFVVVHVGEAGEIVVKRTLFDLPGIANSPEDI